MEGLHRRVTWKEYIEGRHEGELGDAVNFGPATTGGLAIDFKGIVKTNNPLAMGINTNYLMDDRNRRNQQYPLAQALRDLGVGILRYPGGEKSDGVYWAGRDTGTVPNPMVPPH